MKHLLALLILSSLILGAVLYSRIEPDLAVVEAGPAPARDLAEPATTTSTTVLPTTTIAHKRRGAAWPTDELLFDLAMCETGGTMNQKITSPNGRYFSYFQWDLATWAEAGGEGHPHDASYEYQRNRARELILRPRGGWGRWPTCSRVIGAR